MKEHSQIEMLNAKREIDFLIYGTTLVTQSVFVVRFINTEFVGILSKCEVAILLTHTCMLCVYICFGEAKYWCSNKGKQIL